MTAEKVDVLSGPRLERRDEQRTLGIRETVPFRTMLAHRDRLLTELIAWLRAEGITPDGAFFLRLHVVDMGGDMDIEVGAVAAGHGDARVRASTIPAGEYATLSYRATSIAANRLLLRWVGDQDLTLDAHPSPDGEVWTSRCEWYLTDPRTEPKKKAWVVQLAFLTTRTAPSA